MMLGKFKKGQKPRNKGTKGVMKPNSGSFKKGEHPSPRTEFKKGHIPANKGKGMSKDEIKQANRQSQERFRKANPEKVKERIQNYKNKNRDKINKAEREKTIELKTKVMLHYSYGEIHCIHCGETNINFLTIDHINGKKAWKERGGDKKAEALCRWLIREDFPDGFQVLCWNWNQIKTKKENEIERKKNAKAVGNRAGDLKNKIQTLTEYSAGDKPQCRCCRYDELDGLTIHHKYGRKNAPIEEQKAYGDKIYRLLRKKGYPKGRHLTWCFNCNSAASEEGICPHQEHA